ncbi:MAG: hypothetical protein ACYDER_16460, partial [Ktedonobacteraceae bacterium]
PAQRKSTGGSSEKVYSEFAKWYVSGMPGYTFMGSTRRRTDARKGPPTTSALPPFYSYIVGTGEERTWWVAPCGRPSSHDDSLEVTSVASCRYPDPQQ